MLAGVMWFQRQKQLLLANGIAVMVVNTRTFDGWSIDMCAPCHLRLTPFYRQPTPFYRQPTPLPPANAILRSAF